MKEAEKRNPIFYGELNEPYALRVLIGSDDWPQSVVDACAEIMEKTGIPAGILECSKMPPWIN